MYIQTYASLWPDFLLGFSPLLKNPNEANDHIGKTTHHIEDYHIKRTLQIFETENKKEINNNKLTHLKSFRDYIIMKGHMIPTIATAIQSRAGQFSHQTKFSAPNAFLLNNSICSHQSHITQDWIDENPRWRHQQTKGKDSIYAYQSNTNQKYWIGNKTLDGNKPLISLPTIHSATKDQAHETEPNWNIR